MLCNTVRWYGILSLSPLRSVECFQTMPDEGDLILLSNPSVVPNHNNSEPTERTTELDFKEWAPWSSIEFAMLYVTVRAYGNDWSLVKKHILERSKLEVDFVLQSETCVKVLEDI